MDLTELSNCAKQLNEESNKLNNAIEALNDRLATMSLGLNFWLTAKPLTGRYYLGFCKVGDKWRLAVKTGNREEITELLKAPRDIRIAASASFDDLVNGLNKLAEERIESIRYAVKLGGQAVGLHGTAGHGLVR